MKKYIEPLKHIFTVTDRLINSTEFLELYFLRWGVEIEYNEIKHENKDKTLKYVYQANRNYLIGYVIKEFLMLIQLSRIKPMVLIKR